MKIINSLLKILGGWYSMKYGTKIRIKFFTAILCICCMFVTFANPALAAAKNGATNTKNITIVKKDRNIVEVKGVYNGNELYATLDRKTNEITMKAVEKPKSVLNSLMVSKDKTTNYKVNIHDAQKGEKISGEIINSETNQKLLLGNKNESTDKVKAQAPAVIPLIEILGEALLQALIAASATLIVGGVTYVAASEIADTLNDNVDCDYYMAYLGYGDVYIGSGIDWSTACSIVKRNSVNYGVWANSLAKASKLGSNWGGYRLDNPHGDDGYYYHYHSLAYPKSHIWFPW
jgi:hypothetical protein